MYKRVTLYPINMENHYISNIYDKKHLISKGSPWSDYEGRNDTQLSVFQCPGEIRTATEEDVTETNAIIKHSAMKTPQNVHDKNFRQF